MDSLPISPLVLGVLGVIAVIVIAIAGVTRRIKVAGPNEAFIITGRKGRKIDGSESTDLSGQKVVLGASVFVLPVVQQLHVMDLSSRRIPVGIKGAVSKAGIKVDLEGVAIVKVGGNEGSIRAAAQRFLDQQGEIEPFTTEVLAGSLRSIVGSLTVEEIIRDRATFAQRVAEEAEASLTGQGLVLDTFQIQDVRTEGSYLADLGRPEEARVRQEAAIAEARATEAAAREQLLADENIAVAQRQLELRRADIQAETDAARAAAEAAGPLAAAERQQAVIAEQEKVAERNAALKDRQLDTEIRKPADAARYAVEQEAAAQKNATIARAEASEAATVAAARAEAEQTRLTGDGERAKRVSLAEATRVEGGAERDRRASLAEAVEIEGGAEAAAIEARGAAEAAALLARADAFERYGQAAVLELLLKTLPDVVGAAAKPMEAIDTLTVISSDGSDRATGGHVAANVATGLQLASDLTGVDVKEFLAAITQRLTGQPALIATDDSVQRAATTDGGSTGA
jgi:flotillin